MEELFQFGAFGTALGVFRAVSSRLEPKDARETAAAQLADIQQMDLREVNELSGAAEKTRLGFGLVALFAFAVFAISLFFVLPIIGDVSWGQEFDPVRALVLLVSGGWLAMGWWYGQWAYKADLVAKAAHGRVTRLQGDDD